MDGLVGLNEDQVDILSLNPLKQVKSFGLVLLVFGISKSIPSLNPLKQVKSFGLDQLNELEVRFMTSRLNPLKQVKSFGREFIHPDGVGSGPVLIP